MNFLTPEDFDALPAREKKYAYRHLYKSWVLKGGKIKRYKANQNIQTEQRVNGAHETNLNRGSTPVNTYIIKTWWDSMHKGIYLTENDLFNDQRKKFSGEKSKPLKKGTVRNWLTSMNHVWGLYDWDSDQLEQFDGDVRTHKNPRKKLIQQR